ncbi:MAG: TerB family tellurite resistance protein [Spirochaetales bacterium]|nr:TerB family tellurite resistance protein [Spirochaetales bacterium]
MGWLGKIVGGTLGLMFGGPLGAIAGAAFGHAFDKSKEFDRIDENRRWGFDPDDLFGFENSRFSGYATRRLNTTEYEQMTFFVGTFSLLAKLIKADGEVREVELRAVDSFMRNDLRLDPGSMASAKQIFNSALSSREPFEDIASQFYKAFSSQPQMLELLLDILFRVANSDGKVSKPEGRLILEIARIFRFEQWRYDRIKERYVTVTDRHYAILNCTPSDSDETIKKNYRRLVAENHPDKVMAKGLPEEFVDVATRKFQEIQAAYDQIRKERGF